MITERKRVIIKTITKAIKEADEIDGMGFCEVQEIEPEDGYKRLAPGNVYHVLILEKKAEYTGKPETKYKQKIDELRRILKG